jgi:muconolactone delta-isomerase
MEFLVTMTTVIPDGTSADAVDDIRTREAARSRELAAKGELLRLWRPPLEPGEWRTLGLFAASDGEALEMALSSMPLRVWRSDQVTPLSPHPNDPARADMGSSGSEFLTTFVVEIPDGTPEAVAERELAGEATHARELASGGHLQRLWKLTGSASAERALGLWRARDAEEMEAIVASLPLLRWMDVETIPLTPHPNDPESAAVGLRPPRTRGA